MADSISPEDLTPPPATGQPLFNLAIKFLQQQSHPPAPDLVFTDPQTHNVKPTVEAHSSRDPFEAVWEYLEKISGGKSAEERLGDYAWVLEPEKVKSFLNPLGSRSSQEVEVETLQATTAPTTATNATPASPATPATPEITGLRIHAVLPPPYTKDQYPQWETNSFNDHPLSGGRQLIFPQTHQTHTQKMHAIANKLYKNLGHGRVSTNFIPVIGFNPLPPHNFVRVSSHSNKGLHIFVDISNIYLGFIAIHRRLRGMPEGTFVEQPPFAFTDFTVILERCRPTARRVVVGSCSKGEKMPYHVEAQHCGYEVNLLERIPKSRLSKASTRGIKNQTGYASGYSSQQDSTPNTATVGRYGNGEQGVDEILQMKMLESLVDSETPNTLVLATGDAAIAEYSGGFLVNVRRALRKGWKIELVTWKDNMNQEWKHLAKAWDENIRIIFLDDMAEDLLAWYKPV